MSVIMEFGSSRYGIEISPNSRAGCKTCREKISKGEKRWIKKFDTPDLGEQKRYMHFQCLKLSKKDLQVEKVEGLDDFEGKEKEEIDNVFAQAKQPKEKMKKSSPTKTEKKKKRKKNDPHPDMVVKKKKTRVKLDGDGDDIGDPIQAKYSKLTISELKDYLRLNKQILGGKKAELVRACVDGEKNGRLTNCPVCGKGRVRLTDRDTFECKGYYDEDVNMRIPCSYEGTDVTRDKWLIVGVDEEIKDDDGSGGNSESTELTVATLEKIKKKLEPLADSTPREVAIALVKLGRELDVNVPQDSKEATAQAGTVLMSHRNDDDEYDTVSAFIEFRKKLGTKQQAANAAKAKKAARPKAKVEENTQICNVLEELAELTGQAKQGEHYQFKVRSLKKAVNALRTCSFQITSGKQVAAGKQKVPGVGKSTGLLIDEILRDGTVSTIAELKQVIGA